MSFNDYSIYVNRYWFFNSKNKKPLVLQCSYRICNQQSSTKTLGQSHKPLLYLYFPFHNSTNLNIKVIKFFLLHLFHRLLSWYPMSSICIIRIIAGRFPWQPDCWLPLCLLCVMATGRARPLGGSPARWVTGGKWDILYLLIQQNLMTVYDAASNLYSKPDMFCTTRVNVFQLP